MIQHIILGLLACGPLALTLFGWTRLYRTRSRPNALALVALGIVTASATFAAWTYLYYTLRPTPWLPPWKDPEILNFALQFLLAPIGMILGAISAGRRNAPRWLIAIMEIASLPLLFLGIMATLAV